MNHIATKKDALFADAMFDCHKNLFAPRVGMGLVLVTVTAGLAFKEKILMDPLIFGAILFLIILIVAIFALIIDR